MAPVRLPSSTDSRQGWSQLCNPHARACQSPGLGQQVLCPSSHSESQSLDPRDFCSFPPVSSEKGLSSSYHPVRASCLLGFCLAIMAQDEMRGAHPMGLPSSCFHPQAASLLSPLHPPHVVASSVWTAGWGPFPIT